MPQLYVAVYWTGKPQVPCSALDRGANMQNMPICRCRCHGPWLRFQLFFDGQAMQCSAGCCPAARQSLSHGDSHRISTGNLWKMAIHKQT